MAEEKADSLFREKSLERVSSPEQLDDYIKVTKPSIWIVLVALILMLAGIIAWAALGSVDAVTEDGVTESMVPISFITN